MTFFDILKNILNKRIPNMESDLEFSSKFSSYMLVRYLSMREDLLPYAEIIQKFQCSKLDETFVYKWAFRHIPKSKNTFIKYIKSKTINKNK